MAGWGAAPIHWVRGLGCWAQVVFAAPHPRWEQEHPCASPVTHIPGWERSTGGAGHAATDSSGLAWDRRERQAEREMAPIASSTLGQCTLPGREGAA